MEQKFKVGDSVKVLDCATEELADYVGEIGKIVDDGGSYCDWKVEFVSGKIWSADNDELILAKKGNYKPKAPTHLVVWEEDVDPCKFFTSEKEAKDFIKELSEKSEVKKDSIVLVEIKSVTKIGIRKSTTLIPKGFKI